MKLHGETDEYNSIEELQYITFKIGQIKQTKIYVEKEKLNNTINVLIIYG